LRRERLALVDQARDLELPGVRIAGIERAQRREQLDRVVVAAGLPCFGRAREEIREARRLPAAVQIGEALLEPFFLRALRPPR